MTDACLVRRRLSLRESIDTDVSEADREAMVEAFLTGAILAPRANAAGLAHARQAHRRSLDGTFSLPPLRPIGRAHSDSQLSRRGDE